MYFKLYVTGENKELIEERGYNYKMDHENWLNEVLTTMQIYD